jgi:hypothetical protein
MSIGIPEYQTLYAVDHPALVLKGDYCTVEFSQSEAQFLQFVSKLNVSQETVLSSNGVWIKAVSRINPQYPWMLQIRAWIFRAATKSYRIQIEGRQPYDSPTAPPRPAGQ